MQILSLKTPFMGLQAIEKIEIRRFLLLIGEQASGKSTLAKLIYFFQKVPEYAYESIYADLEGYTMGNKSNPNCVIDKLEDEFYQAFGQIKQKELDIYFHYSSINTTINIKKVQNEIIIELSEYLREKLQTVLDTTADNFYKAHLGQTKGYHTILFKVFSQLRLALNALFDNQNTDFSYIIAGRSTTVAFPDMIEARLAVELENVIESTIKKQQFGRRIGNEYLLLQFINWARELRIFFKNNGGTFISAKERLTHHESLDILIGIFERILKGKYDFQNGDETLIINENEKIGFKDASSGQQEVLRILQGIFVATGTENRTEMMIVEEPEAHLFPLAQREIIHAFALFLNTIQGGKLIITTHSPYILACVNVLLMAKYVAQQKEKHIETIDTKIVKKYFWIDSADFSVYSLGHEVPYCVNVKDDVTGLINQNYLDSISEALGMQYQQLYQLLTR